MENTKSNLDTIMGVLGLVTLITLIFHALKSIDDATETNVISDDALKAIQDPEKAKQLRQAVDDYHDTGEWNRGDLESIL
ncbi:hypothetical protein [Nonlabens sp. Asnod3-A02]|uniref:hypothetical protein n=1 Tax=Nonlabens sp. Asnod3-A02 TaxID=3160579 RepID=UPI003865C669